MCGRHSIHICVTLHGWLQSTRSCQRTILILVRYCLLNKTFTYSQLTFIYEGHFPIHHLGTAGLELKSPNLFLREKVFQYFYYYIFYIYILINHLSLHDIKCWSFLGLSLYSIRHIDNLINNFEYTLPYFDYDIYISPINSTTIINS